LPEHPPGPDFLAEAGRILPGDAELEALDLAEAWMGQAEAGQPAGPLDEAWLKRFSSKSEKRRDIARRKAKKLARAQVDAARAGRLDEAVRRLHREALLDPDFSLPVAVKGRAVVVNFCPGHLMREDAPKGPAPAPVVVLGKNPGAEEERLKLNFSGQGSEPFWRAVGDLNLRDEVGTWYATSLVRHQPADPSSSTISASSIKNCLPILMEELRLVRPKFILCLGGDSASGLLGRKVKLDEVRGKTLPLQIGPGDGGEPPYEAKVVAILHPAFVYREPIKYDEFRDSLADFAAIVRGRRPRRHRPRKRDHVNIYKERHLARVVDEIVADPAGATIAMDCEWHGNWFEPGGWLRTIQFSHRAGTAHSVVLRHAGGAPAFKPGIAAVLPHLIRLCKSTPGRPVRVGGHFFRADLPWLIQFGLDLRDEFAAPASPELTRTAGGFDTGYMLHAVFETGRPFTLEPYADKLLGIGRYDLPLDKCVAEMCAARKVSKAKLGGYGDIPDEILLPYAAFDADAVRELFDHLNGAGGKPGLLDRDRFGLNSRAGFWTSQRAALAFLEMEMRGLVIDRRRLDQLVSLFASTSANKLAELRREIGWPDFNPGSVEHIRELLFGEQYNGKKHNGKEGPAGTPKRLRPPDALTLGLEPMKSTGKQSKPWSRVVEEDEEDLYNVAADKEILGIYSHQHPIVAKLRDVKFLRQLLVTPLSMPALDESGAIRRRADGTYDYDKGIATFIASDGRVRTNFFPIETGRCASGRPALQNWSSKRESDYKRILKQDYLFPARSIFVASPGHAIVKVDIKSAELVVVGRLSQDRNMLSDLARSSLPEDHPDYRDMHSATAVEAFRLDCAPTKKALAEAGHSAKRTAAKNQKFGYLYGRGAVAMAMQCREEGANVEPRDIEDLNRAFEARCPNVVGFLGASGARSVDPGHLTNPFGRHRRFGETSAREVLQSADREAKNFTIQSTVADFVSLLTGWLHDYRRAYAGPHRFHFLLQIHDELDFEVPVESLEWFCGEVLPAAFSSIPVPIADLDGVPLPGVEPFLFDFDSAIYLRWGEKLDPEEARAAGIPAAFLGGDD